MSADRDTPRGCCDAGAQERHWRAPRASRWWPVTAALLVLLLLAAGPASAHPYVYVSDEANGTVAQFDAASWALRPLSPPTVAVGNFNGAYDFFIGADVAVHPDGRSVYVAGTDEGLRQYDVAPDGALSPKSPPVVPGDSLVGQVAVSPDGRNVYASCADRSEGYCNEINQYSVGHGGNLKRRSPPYVRAGNGPINGIAIAPDGSSVYVVASVDSVKRILRYPVKRDGRLGTPVVASLIDRRVGVYTLALSPDGHAAYVTTYPVSSSGGDAGFAIQMFSVEPGGRLEAHGRALRTGRLPFSIVVSPDGRSVYVVTFDGVDQYTALAGGGLSRKSPAAAPWPSSTSSGAISGDGRRFYVLRGGGVVQYTVQAGGALGDPRVTSLLPGEVAAEVAVNPPVRARPLLQVRSRVTAPRVTSRSCATVKVTRLQVLPAQVGAARRAFTGRFVLTLTGRGERATRRLTVRPGVGAVWRRLRAGSYRLSVLYTGDGYRLPSRTIRRQVSVKRCR